MCKTAIFCFFSSNWGVKRDKIQIIGRDQDELHTSVVHLRGQQIIPVNVSVEAALYPMGNQHIHELLADEITENGREMEIDKNFFVLRTAQLFGLGNAVLQPQLFSGNDLGIFRIVDGVLHFFFKLE